MRSASCSSDLASSVKRPGKKSRYTCYCSCCRKLCIVIIHFCMTCSLTYIIHNKCIYRPYFLFLFTFDFIENSMSYKSMLNMCFHVSCINYILSQLKTMFWTFDAVVCQPMFFSIHFFLLSWTWREDILLIFCCLSFLFFFYVSQTADNIRQSVRWFS